MQPLAVSRQPSPSSLPGGKRPLDPSSCSSQEGVLPEADWRERFHSEGAKLLQSLQKVTEEHLRQQELFVGEILEGAKPNPPGIRREDLSLSDNTSVAEQCTAGKEREAHNVQNTQVPSSSLRAVFPQRRASNTSSNPSHLRDYLDSEVGNLTAGVMSVHESRTATFSLLASPSSMQQLHQVYKGLQEPQREGPLARIVTSTQFEIMTFIVIAAYGIFVIWMTNLLLPQPDILESAFVVWAESIFLLLFVLELSARLAVHRLYFFCNGDMGWNMLDFLIILFSLVDFSLNFFTELKDMNYLRVVRALRISKSLRVLRAVRVVNELRVLVNCIITSFSVLFWCVILLLLIQAGVSTALVQLVAGYVQENDGRESHEVELLRVHFGSVQASMMSLFQSTTGGVDWGQFYDLIAKTGAVAQWFYVCYLLFFFIAAWNIITSLFMEKAMTLSQPDIETQMLSKHREDMQHASEIVKILEETDMNRTGTISLARFKQYMENPRFRTFFECRDLEIKDAEMFFRILSSVTDSEDVKYDAFAYGCMRMKGYASSLDVQCLRVELKTMYLNQANQFNFLARELFSVKSQLTAKPSQDMRQEGSSFQGQLTQSLQNTLTEHLDSNQELGSTNQALTDAAVVLKL